ncbi:MAG TPA: hypothetical protein PLU72_05310 [Candidatus Ozemobacteraceae bacterium]|nr:hypothetical protein [Candidatus Ozemobacteraceae bacterium]
MTSIQLDTTLPGSESTYLGSETMRAEMRESHALVGSMGISNPKLRRWSEIERDSLFDIMKKLLVPIQALPRKESRSERYSRLLARLEAWKEDESGYDARVWPLVKKGLKADPVKCREPGS